jgi:signal peptidase I
MRPYRPGTGFERAPARGVYDDGGYGGGPTGEGGDRPGYDTPDHDRPDYDDGDYFDDDDVDEEELARGSNATRNALEWAVVLVGAVLVALVLRAALFQAFWIPSESMESTLLVNDRVLVNKVSYKLHDVHRGDVVVFVRPDGEPGDIKDLIKRVIGLPGDTVQGKDDSVYINGERLVEPYLAPGTPIDDFGPIVVPEGDMFVMGDNRGESFDSRKFGPIPENRIVGLAFVLFLPLNRVGWL